MKRILRTLAWLTAIALWCISFYLLLSTSPYVGTVHVPTHGAHTVLFFGLAFMTTCAQQRPNIVLTLAVLYVFGGLTEIVQHFHPPRTCDLLDFIEDVVGSTIGVVAALVWMAWLRHLLRFMNMHCNKGQNTARTS
ncbi:MAG: VanZ family protein [Planctomycetaceae bacterium]|nr:VanZ family protein [Planctomycetaceae bacterium]